VTKFADQLFDDLMREHGGPLADMPVPGPARRHVTRPVLLAAGAGGAAVAATVGLLTAGGGTPAYAVTANPNGTVTLDVYDQSGIAGANGALHKLGDQQVVVVPVQAGCPAISSLPKVPGHPDIQVTGTVNEAGAVTVDAHGIPKGDILVVAVVTSGQGRSVVATGDGKTTANGKTVLSMTVGQLTRPPAPSCVSISGLSAPGGSGRSGGGTAPVKPSAG
jgi:hypothetical protein